MKIDSEVSPLLQKALLYMHDESHAAESIERCRHLYMAVWTQVGEDYGKLYPGPKNLLTHAATGVQVSGDLEEKLRNMEEFFSSLPAVNESTASS